MRSVLTGWNKKPHESSFLSFHADLSLGRLDRQVFLTQLHE